MSALNRVVECVCKQCAKLRIGYCNRIRIELFGFIVRLNARFLHGIDFRPHDFVNNTNAGKRDFNTILFHYMCDFFYKFFNFLPFPFGIQLPQSADVCTHILLNAVNILRMAGLLNTQLQFKLCLPCLFFIVRHLFLCNGNIRKEAELKTYAQYRKQRERYQQCRNRAHERNDFECYQQEQYHQHRRQNRQKRKLQFLNTRDASEPHVRNAAHCKPRCNNRHGNEHGNNMLNQTVSMEILRRIQARCNKCTGHDKLSAQHDNKVTDRHEQLFKEAAFIQQFKKNNAADNFDAYYRKLPDFVQARRKQRKSAQHQRECKPLNRKDFRLASRFENISAAQQRGCVIVNRPCSNCV